MSATDDYMSHPDDPAQKVRHLDNVAQMSSERKQHVYALLHVGQGHRVLDVGCGVGVDTLPLARLVGPCPGYFPYPAEIWWSRDAHAAR